MREHKSPKNDFGECSPPRPKNFERSSLPPSRKRGRSNTSDSSKDTRDPKKRNSKTDASLPSKGNDHDSSTESPVKSKPCSPSDSPDKNSISHKFENSSPSETPQPESIPSGSQAGQLSDISQACNSMETALKSVLVEAMKNNGNSSPLSITSGVEIFAIINLSKLFKPEREEIGEAARNGASQLQEGKITARKQLKFS